MHRHCAWHIKVPSRFAPIGQHALLREDGILDAPASGHGTTQSIEDRVPAREQRGREENPFAGVQRGVDDAVRKWLGMRYLHRLDVPGLDVPGTSRHIKAAHQGPIKVPPFGPGTLLHARGSNGDEKRRVARLPPLGSHLDHSLGGAGWWRWSRWGGAASVWPSATWPAPPGREESASARRTTCARCQTRCEQVRRVAADHSACGVLAGFFAVLRRFAQSLAVI